MACIKLERLSDVGGQQTLSPYHAMGCNPALMVDPFGLQGQTGMSSPNGNNHFVALLAHESFRVPIYLNFDYYEQKI